VEGSQKRASGEEVNPPAPQLARAGAGEHKSLPPARLEEFMDDIQQLGDSLDLVHNDRVALGGPEGEVAQALRAGAHLAVDLGPEKVHEERSRQLVLEPGRLPRPSRTEEEKALGWQLEESTSEFHFSTQNGVDDSGM
jgi:hypothetical protein